MDAPVGRTNEDLPNVRDPTFLTDDDWEVVRCWQRAYREGGVANLLGLMDELAAVAINSPRPAWTGRTPDLLESER
jgi:hypothetical protein